MQILDLHLSEHFPAVRRSTLTLLAYSYSCRLQLFPSNEAFGIVRLTGIEISILLGDFFTRMTGTFAQDVFSEQCSRKDDINLALGVY